MFVDSRPIRLLTVLLLTGISTSAQARRAGRPATAEPSSASSVDHTAAAAGPADRATVGSPAPANEAAADQIHNKLLRFSFRGGRVRLQQGAEELRLGLFGQRTPDLFAHLPEAHAAATSYYHYRMGSTITYTIGAGSIIAGLVYAIVRNSQHQGVMSRGERSTSSGLVLGGALFEIVGISLYNAMGNYLAQAVNISNDAMIDNELGVARQSVGRVD